MDNLWMPFITAVLFPFMLALLLKLIEGKKNLSVLEKQFEVYKELYYNVVEDNLHQKIDRDRARQYLRDFSNRLSSDLDFNMLFSQNIIIRLRKYLKKESSYIRKQHLANRIRMEFNQIRRSLGYPAEPSKLQWAVLWVIGFLLLAFVAFVITSWRIGITAPTFNSILLSVTATVAFIMGLVTFVRALEDFKLLRPKLWEDVEPKVREYTGENQQVNEGECRK
ncbi:MAG: hypothetical protein FWE06_00965 [Oscillospiraceae bacterium]|nr:hypothetical protein [Oscillospiraceae bacterium]